MKKSIVQGAETRRAGMGWGGMVQIRWLNATMHDSNAENLLVIDYMVQYNLLFR